MSSESLIRRRQPDYLSMSSYMSIGKEICRLTNERNRKQNEMNASFSIIIALDLCFFRNLSMIFVCRMTKNSQLESAISFWPKVAIQPTGQHILSPSSSLQLVWQTTTHRSVMCSSWSRFNLILNWVGRKMERERESARESLWLILWWEHVDKWYS